MDGAELRVYVGTTVFVLSKYHATGKEWGGKNINLSGQIAGFEAVKQRFAGNNAKILEIRVGRDKCGLKSM